jgi:hypothetical protein
MSSAKQRDNSARDFGLESLESRRLFAAGFAFPPVASKFFGPVYVAPQRPPQEPIGGLVTRKVVSTTSDQIAVIDVTFSDNHPEFERGWWSGPIQWRTGKGTTTDFSQARVTEIANYARDGGVERWTKQTVRQNALTVLDFEGSQISAQSPEYLAERIRWFKAVAPDAPVTTYGINPGTNGFTLDVTANPTSAQLAQMKAHAKSYAPFVNELSAINVDTYLLGPTKVSRDLAAMANIAKVLRSVYPNKPILAHAWGAYHTSWNKANSVLSDEVTQRYINTIRQYFDGVVVWGPAADNVKMLSMLSKPANRTRLAPVASTPPRLPVDTQTSIPAGTNTGAIPIKNEIEL